MMAAKAVVAEVRISHLKICSQKGFTLLEIMVVLAILAAIVTMALPRLGNRNYQLKSAVRRIGVLSKELHSLAKLKNATYRIAIKMDNPDNGEAINEYWVEKTTHKVLFSGKSKSLREIKEEREQQQDKGHEATTNSNGFAIDQTITKEIKSLPSGLVFDDVELSTSETPIDEGIAYIHYLPEGLVEEAAIHIKFEKNNYWTIAIHPLTGRADIIGKRVSLEEVREQ